MLQEKAMLSYLRISQWSGRKNDKSISEEVRRNHNVKSEAGNFHKRLVEKDSLKKINVISTQARLYHYANTLPWSDDGNRVLTAAHYMEYVSKIQKFKSDFGQQVIDFCDNYEQLVEQQKDRLNGLFKQSDYPAVGVIRSKFNLDVMISPLADQDDFRVRLGESEVNKIREEITKRERELTSKAMKDCWSRLYEVVKNLHTKLADKDGVFRNSLIGNISNLIDLLPKLNLTNDSELEKMRREIELKIVSFDPDSIRKDSNLRQNVTNEANKLLEQMSGYVS